MPLVRQGISTDLEYSVLAAGIASGSAGDPPKELGARVVVTGRGGVIEDRLGRH